MHRVYSLFVLMLACVALDMLSCSIAHAGTLSMHWTAPTTCEDGSALTNCATTGYKIYSGACGQAKTTVIATPAATETSASIPNLPAGKICVDMTTLAGTAESVHTSEASTTIPAPLPSPPGNVTATVQIADNSAYKMRQAVDGFSFVVIGKIPVGTTCDTTHNVDGYSVVPRTNVTLSSRFDTLPLVVYAKCS